MTGGAKGIGRMIAEGFVANGARVYLAGRDAAACAAAVDALAPLAARAGGAVRGLAADLQSLDDCRRLADAVAAAEPAGLHVLVNNAGAAWGERIDDYPDAAWTKVLTLNLQRVFTLTQMCLPQLERAARPGDPARVVHIGSIDGLRAPAVANFAYSASKAGLHHLSRALARELGPRHVTSNVVACGPFATKMMRATLEAFGDAIAAEVPLRRIGCPDDVAGACIYLASRAGCVAPLVPLSLPRPPPADRRSAYCNGALIRVDGGASLASKI